MSPSIYLPRWFAHNLPAFHVPLILLAAFLYGRNLRPAHGAVSADPAPGNQLDGPDWRSISRLISLSEIDLRRLTSQPNAAVRNTHAPTG